jgi:hypothetical protein
VREVVIVPTYQRNHYLHCCLRRIREQDSAIDIAVFSDRGETNHELRTICRDFDAKLKITPAHNLYGNSYCVLEALRWAGGQPYDLIHVNEDDAMQHPDCLAWHREQHGLFDDIFASCGWVFNRCAPIEPDLMFAGWYYSPNACFRRDKLRIVTQHANPSYYHSMREYVLKVFADSPLHKKGSQQDTNYYEQDAVIQFCINRDGSQVAWCGIAKVDHVGAFGYNRTGGPKFIGTLQERVAQVEELIGDPYYRMELFGRDVVEREVGYVLPKKEYRYQISIPGGWTSELVTEIPLRRLPKKINSVILPENAQIISL